MKPTDRENAQVALTETDRRTCTVEKHAAWLESISGNDRQYDAIDIELDEMIEVPWPEINPPSRRKDSEINRVLSILDNLPTGKDSK